MWELWRQDDNGNRVRMSAHPDRVSALARQLTFEAGPRHRQLYTVTGPAAACTAGDLVTRAAAEGERMAAAGRGLGEFLRAWWWVTRPLADRPWLALDEVAATIAAAADAEPPAVAPPDVIDEADGYAGFAAVLLAQVADLADLGPPGEYAYFGVQVVRPAHVRRPTPLSWYNHDPAGYLECGLRGGLRPPVPARLDWDALADVAVCGQIYE